MPNYKKITIKTCVLSEKRLKCIKLVFLWIEIFKIEKRKNMIGSNAYSYINVLDKAADASWIRNEVIANNLANISTPNYKRKDVNFEQYLEKELTGKDMLTRKVNSLELDHLKATTYTDHATLSYRLDGNNVDVDTENAYLADNQLKYYTLVDSITQEFSRLRTVLTK